MGFRKAERRKAKLRLALCGPAGSGKTFSALLIAQGLGGKIAMIDTENGSGELYSNLCAYDVATITPPFTPDKYVETIHEAEAAGYDVIIIDSLSHAWAGEGGVLDMQGKAADAEKNSYTAWRKVTPKHNRLVDSILQSSCHVIACMRSKMAYELVENDKGKKVPRKLGMAPVQRDGMEYEFTLVLDLSVDGHVATSSKDRTGIFDGKYLVPTIECGKDLLKWLDAGIEVPPPSPKSATPVTGSPHCDGKAVFREIAGYWCPKGMDPIEAKATTYAKLNEYCDKAGVSRVNDAAGLESLTADECKKIRDAFADDKILQATGTE
jgi:hypothetical protein